MRRTGRPPVPAEIWVLVAAAFLIALGYGLVAPILPQFARSFDVGVMAASAIVSIFAFVRLVFAPAGGVFIGRFGERRIYLVGLLIVATSSALCGIADTYWTLLLFRGLGGIGSVMFTVSAMGLLVRLAPTSQRGHVSSLYGSAFLIGNILGPILGSLLGGLGMRLPFYIYAVAVYIAAAVVFLFLRGGIGAAPDADQTQATFSLAEALRIPYYRALLVTGLANGWSNFGVRIALVPLMAAAVPAIGKEAAGIALTLFAIGSAVTQQFSGRLVDRHGRLPFLMLGLLISAAATIGFGWLDSLPWFLALSVLGGVGGAFVGPASQALLADLIGANRNGGPALATYSMATDLGSIAGTLVAGWVADQVGFGWAFGTTGIVLAVSIIPWLLVRRRPSPAS